MTDGGIPARRSSCRGPRGPGTVAAPHPQPRARGQRSGRPPVSAQIRRRSKLQAVTHPDQGAQSTRADPIPARSRIPVKRRRRRRSALVAPVAATVSGRRQRVGGVEGRAEVRVPSAGCYSPMLMPWGRGWCAAACAAHRRNGAAPSAVTRGRSDAREADVPPHVLSADPASRCPHLVERPPGSWSRRRSPVPPQHDVTTTRANTPPKPFLCAEGPACGRSLYLSPARAMYGVTRRLPH